MGSEAAVEVEKAAPNPHESSPRDDPVEEEQVTPQREEKRGTKRETPEKEEGEPEEDEDGSSKKRPSRERKTVERYSALSPRKPSASKALSIEQGSGTMLKDIPNVAFKISKRKADENLQALHGILFGRKSKALYVKRNIFQFSGFVWSTNEEKQKVKVKEKLDKYTKDKLVDFCDLLDINFPKASTKKEEISAKLLEFLESPHVTRDLLLAEKEKKAKKRRSRSKVTRAVSGDASSDKETKKRKKRSGTRVEKGQKETAKPEDEDDEDSVGSDGSKHASSGEDVNDLQESDHVNDEEEENEEEPQVSSKVSDDAPTEDADELKGEQSTTPIKKSPSGRSDGIPSKRVSKKTDPSVEDEPEIATDSKHSVSEEPARKTSKVITKNGTPVRSDDKKKSSRKSASFDASESGPSKCSNSKGEDKMKDLIKEKDVVEEKNARKKKDKPEKKTNKKEDKPEKKAKKKEDKPEKKVSVKKQGRGKTTASPSREELHSVLIIILREVDFNTATLADILKKLGTHFNMDLMDRKPEVKSIIEEVINSMTDDDDADEDGDGEGEDKKGESDEDGE